MKKLIVCVLALSGCITPQAFVTKQASVDHGCLESDIRLVSSSDNRNAVLDVCGKTRRYRDMNGSIYEGMPVWVDVTKLAEK